MICFTIFPVARTHNVYTSKCTSLRGWNKTELAKCSGKHFLLHHQKTLYKNYQTQLDGTRDFPSKTSCLKFIAKLGKSTWIRSTFGHQSTAYVKIIDQRQQKKDKDTFSLFRTPFACNKNMDTSTTPQYKGKLSFFCNHKTSNILIIIDEKMRR